MELDSMGLYDIYALHKVPFWQTQWFCYALVTLGLIVGSMALFALVYVINRRYFTRKQTPWEKALAHLDELNSNSRTGEQRYDALSTIIKTYVTERFNIDCFGKTDEELARELEAFMHDVPIKPVCAVLHRGIDVKFAQCHALMHQSDEDVNHVKTFVQSTIPSSP